MFGVNDLARPRVPVAENDHNGVLRTWKPTCVLRVLHTSPDGDVVLADDSRGLRVKLHEGRLVMHRRADQQPTTETTR